MPRKKKLKRPQPEWLEGGYKPKSRGKCEECGKPVYKKPYYYRISKKRVLIFHQRHFAIWLKRQVKEGKI